MDPQQMFKQMMDFQKATFDNAFDAMTQLQQQGESMVEMFTGQAPWLPEEGKKVVQDWLGAYRTGREDFKKAADANYDKVQEYFSAFKAGGSK